MLAEQNKSINNRSLAEFFLAVDLSIPKVNWADRDTVLVQFLQYFEYYFVFEIPKIVNQYGIDSARATEDMARSAANYMVSWIYQQCSIDQNSRYSELDINQQKMEQLKALLEHAVKYSNMQDLKNVLYEGFYDTELISPNHIRLKYSNHLQIQGQAAEWLLKGLCKNPNDGFTFDPTAIIKEALNKLSITKNYEVSAENVRHVISAANSYLQPVWQLDGNLDFLFFTLSEFRRFWTALYALSDIQLNLSRIIAGLNGFPFKNNLLIMSFEDWVTKIVNLTELESHKVEALVDFLTYQPSGETDIALQPFLSYPMAKSY